MTRRPRVLFLANWPRTHRRTEKYAFFAHWESGPRVRFLGTLPLGPWTWLEKRVFRFYLAQALVALILAPFYDVVVAYSAQSGLPLAALLRLCFWMRTKLIVFDVESFGRARSGVKKKLVRFAARRIDHVLYPTRDQEAYYQEVLPFLTHRRTFTPLGVGTYENKLPADAGRKGPLLTLGKQGAAFRDWETLLKAYAKLENTPELQIVGRSKLPPQERGFVPIPPGVKLTPYSPIDKLQEMVERSRFVILPLPERDQSLGQLTLLFCMALGKAVIASRVIGLADYLTDDKTGLFYRAGDADDLAQCIRRLLEDDVLTRRLGASAQLAVRERFNDRLFARRWEEVFLRVTGWGAAN